MLPYVMEFIELRQVANSAVVSQHFNYGCSLYKYYTDVRDSVPWNVSMPGAFVELSLMPFTVYRFV
jgi:hypothetical protein